MRHYFIGDELEVKNIVRKQGDGKDIIINGIGVIKSIHDYNFDIGYNVEFNLKLEHKSQYGTKWTTNKNMFTIFHNGDHYNIKKI